MVPEATCELTLVAKSPQMDISGKVTIFYFPMANGLWKHLCFFNFFLYFHSQMIMINKNEIKLTAAGEKC